MKRLLRTLILLVVRLIGAPGAYLAARKAQAPVSGKPRILLVRPDHLGDMLLVTPVLDALKTHVPDAHITMVVGPWSSEIVARHPAVDRLLTCPFPGFQRAPQKALAPYILLFSYARKLRRGHYDLAINLRPDFWWGAALLYLARIPHRVGYAIASGTPFLTRALPFQAHEHAAVSNLRLTSTALALLGDAPLAEPYTPSAYPLQFVPTTEERAWVAERLRNEGIDAETPVVLIHPGSGAAVKLWRSEAWASCANALPALLTTPAPARIILTGGKSERPLLEEIARGMAASPVMITDASVGQLAALLGRAVLVLGVDSGPLHLAVAQGTPTVVIFGPTDARIFGPWGDAGQHIVIASTQRCPTCPYIPCGRLDFRPDELAAHPCVRLLPEQAVLTAIRSLSILKQQPGDIEAQ
ncbi:MAG TPA: glycosyltransferase family 9 protein, partial [Ktedonobacteraceae bacterium]|nr:glycosyltransferase family 9 protein [Ktedonobacteraceae bacterium]